MDMLCSVFSHWFNGCDSVMDTLCSVFSHWFSGCGSVMDTLCSVFSHWFSGGGGWLHPGQLVDDGSRATVASHP